MTPKHFGTQLVDTSAGRIFVRRNGSGPKLVLIHGYLVSQHYFEAVRGELESHFDVIGIDLPGHGESDRPLPAHFDYDLPAMAGTVAETLSAIGVDRAHVYGHSMGGGVALTLAARHPERVDRLVLEDAAIYPVPVPLSARIALNPTVGEFIFKNLYTRALLKDHLANAYRDRTLLTEEFLDYYWERFNRAGTRTAVYAILKKLSVLVDNTGDPGRIVSPTLIVWGDEDRIVPLGHGKRMVRQIPGARLEIVPACGHSPHEERPEELLRLVLPFLLAAEKPQEMLPRAASPAASAQ